MAESALKDVLKMLKKNYENVEANIGVKQTEKNKFSFGTPSLDLTTYNSVPEGIFIEISGAEHSGKTLLSYLIASDFIKKESKKSIDERRHILFVDAEGTLDKDWAFTSTGYDTQSTEVETLYYVPTGESAEQIFDFVRTAVQSGKIGLVIFDSLTAIAPQQTNEESFEKKDMGGLSKPLADFVKRCTGLFHKYNTTFIGINGDIQNIGAYAGGTTTAGGTYWKRACSLRIKVKKSSYIDDDGNELKSNAENPAGMIIESVILKSKFCRSDRRLGRFHLNFRKGVDILLDTIDSAIVMGLITQVNQMTFALIDTDTGEALVDENNVPITIKGRKNLKPYFEQHLDVWRKLYDKLYVEISKKDDPNCVSFEKMLGIDVKDRFKLTSDSDDEGNYDETEE